LLLQDPIIVAIDVDDWGRLVNLVQVLQGEVETVKVGLELYTNLGPEIIEELRYRGFRVFADLKLHDIPNTVQGAVRGLVRRGVDILTIHASGGSEMMRQAVFTSREEAETLGVPPPLVLGVTLLTSLGKEYLNEVGWTSTVDKIVLALAGMAIESGLDGVVASAWEVEKIRSKVGSEPIIVTPGIRMPGDQQHDQIRTVDPATALAAGANYLVVGRAVTGATDPRSALRAMRTAVGLA
jgi:orotidine-5'-phosphate decarboxylase